MKNKKGQMEIMWLFVIFMAILVIGFLLAIAIGIFHWTSGVVAPIMSDLGEVDGTNISDAGRMVFGTADTLLGMAPMLVGVGYLILLVGCIGLVLMYRGTQNPLFIGLYFAFMILLILLSVLVSNAYQDIYEGSDVIGLELQGMTMLSFLILQSPMIFGVVGFICGIFLFSGRQSESSGYGGVQGY